jgi:hypothetical protein
VGGAWRGPGGAVRPAGPTLPTTSTARTDNLGACHATDRPATGQAGRPAPGAPSQLALTAAKSLVRESFASPKRRIVFGS